MGKPDKKSVFGRLDEHPEDFNVLTSKGLDGAEAHQVFDVKNKKYVAEFFVASKQMERERDKALAEEKFRLEQAIKRSKE
jgi:hypothetical protein